jgi:DNA-binding transcriptional ArsR family regulator
MEEKARKIAELLKILANENRLLILCALINGPLTVSEIYEHTPNITQSALSQHLSHLRTAGILNSVKQGMNVVYTLSDERVVGLMATLKKYYCQEKRDEANNEIRPSSNKTLRMKGRR